LVNALLVIEGPECGLERRGWAECHPLFPPDNAQKNFEIFEKDRFSWEDSM
jgi:hypothetical protein